MKDRIRLPLTFDPKRMQRDLAMMCRNDWIPHFVKQNYEGDWSVIPLRGPANAAHPVMQIYSDPGCTEFSDTPLLEQTEYFPEVLASFLCPLHAVRLMRLAPGSKIRLHSDFDLAAEDGTARLHIPVRTNPGVEFMLNGKPVAMAEGECWYLRLSDPHEVENRGATDRVHLVVDAVVNDWLGAALTDT